MKIAVSYARVSTNKEEQKESLKQQKEFFKEYVKRNDLLLETIYADEGISGTKTKNRKQFMKMMSDARAGKFEVLLVKDVSRLARNTYDFLKCVRELRELGIKVIYLSYGGETFEGELVLTIMAAIAQEESHNMSRRVKFGKQAGKENGKVPNLVFGYDKLPNDKYTLQVNEDEAELVQEIFNMYTVQNMGESKIAVSLNERGFRTKRGCEWSQHAISRILKNQIYIGIVYNGKEEVENFLTGKRIKKKQEEWYKKEYPELQIISNEQFKEAQNLLAKRAEDFKLFNKKESSKFTFSTLIKCECCGRSFRHIDRKDCREVYYVCNTRNEKGVGACENKTRVIEPELKETLEKFFSKFVKNKESEIMRYAREIKRLYDRDEQAKFNVYDIDDKIEKLKNEREQEIHLWKSAIISEEDLQKRAKPINQEINRLEAQKNRYTFTCYSVEEIAKILRREYKCIEDLARGENFTNENLKRVLDKVVVTPEGKVDIFIKPFDEIGLMENVRFSDNQS